MACDRRFLLCPGKNLLCRLPQGEGQHPQQRQVRKGPQSGDDALHPLEGPVHPHAFGQGKKGAVQPLGQLRAQVADDHRLFRPQQEAAAAGPQYPVRSRRGEGSVSPSRKAAKSP